VADPSLLEEVSAYAVKVTYSAPVTNHIIKYEAFGIFAEDDGKIPTQKDIDEVESRYIAFSKKIWDTKEWYPDIIDHEYNTTGISDHISIYVREPPCSIIQDQYNRGERAHIPIRYVFAEIPIKCSADSASVVAMCTELTYETKCDSVVWQRHTDSWNSPVNWIPSSEITVDNLYQTTSYGYTYDSRVNDMNRRWKIDNQYMYMYKFEEKDS
jgi:hypothetical protein